MIQMKMIIAIVQDQDSDVLSKALIEANVRSTKLASTGGFLKAGKTTFMIGVPEEQVNDVLLLIQDNCSKREEIMMQQSMLGIDTLMSYPVNVSVGGATVFVLPIEQFVQF